MRVRLLLAAFLGVSAAQPEVAVRELPAAKVGIDLAVVLERARVAARTKKPRDRELKAQIERLRARAELASPRPDRPAGKDYFGESKERILVVERDAKAFIAKDGALQVARVMSGVLVVDGDVDVGFARNAVIVATGAVSVAHDYDSVIVGGAYVGVSHDHGGVLLSGGLLDVSHADDSVLVGRDLRVSGVQERLTCVNAETVALTCDRVRDPSIAVGAAASLDALASKVSIIETRTDTPHAWLRVDGGPEVGAAKGEIVPGLDGWKLALPEHDFVLFRKGDEVSGWRIEPRERRRLFVATESGEVHVLDRETLGRRRTWTPPKKTKEHVWLFFGGGGKVYAASESGRAQQLSEGNHPVEVNVRDPIRQATLVGSSLILQGKSLHALWSSSSWSTGSMPRVQSIPLGATSAVPPHVAYITQGGRTYLADGSHVLQPDFGRDPSFQRRDVGGEVAALLPLPDESALLALLRGDEKTPPRVVTLAPDTLEIRKTLTLPKPGRVHDVALTQDASRLLVALGERVACVHLASGEVLWEIPAPGGGHVRLINGRAAIFGHASAELTFADPDRGAVDSTIALGLESPQLGHSLGWDHWTNQLALIDVAGKRVLLVKDGKVHASAPFEATPTAVVFVHR